MVNGFEEGDETILRALQFRSHYVTYSERYQIYVLWIPILELYPPSSIEQMFDKDVGVTKHKRTEHCVDF